MAANLEALGREGLQSSRAAEPAANATRRVYFELPQNTGTADRFLVDPPPQPTKDGTVSFKCPESPALLPAGCGASRSPAELKFVERSRGYDGRNNAKTITLYSSPLKFIDALLVARLHEMCTTSPSRLGVDDDGVARRRWWLRCSTQFSSTRTSNNEAHQRARQ